MSDGIVDSVTETVDAGVGSRLASSLSGMLVGIVLFLASFAVLWWNEGNVIAEKNALEEMRRSLVKTDVSKPNPKHEGKLVHATNKLSSSEKLGDAPYLAPGPYLSVARKVEMYQWVEHEETKKSGSKKTTTYTYSKEWAEGREDSSRFKKPAGHENPQLTVQPASHSVKAVTFGKLNGLPVLERLSADERLPVTPKLLTPAQKKAELQDGMIYLRKTRGAKEPVVGDVRISYHTVNPGTFSVIAKQTGKTLTSHHAKNGKENFLVERGAKPPQAMIQTAKEAAGFFAMIMRVVGFAMMFFGLNLLAGPITTLLDFIPIIGTAGRFVVGAIFFVVSAVLSAITIGLSMIAHNPIALAIAAVALLGGGYLLWQRRREGKAPQARAPAQAAAPMPSSAAAQRSIQPRKVA